MDSELFSFLKIILLKYNEKYCIILCVHILLLADYISHIAFTLEAMQNTHKPF